MPDQSNVHIDAALSMISVRYSNDQFIADQVCPIVSVRKRTDKYWVYGKEHFRTYRTRRAPGTEAAQIDWELSTDTYSTDSFALSALITDEERDNADSQIDLEGDTTELITDGLLLDRELKVATFVTDTANVGGHTSPGTKWATLASCDPVTDVLTAKEAMRNLIGYEPNLMVLPKSAYFYARQAKKIIDRIQYTKQRGQVTLDDLRALFEIDNIILPGAKYETAQEGDTSALADIWGDTVGLFYVNPTPKQKAISFAYTFRQQPFQVQRERRQRVHSDWIEASMREDIKVVAPGAGYLLTDVVS